MDTTPEVGAAKPKVLLFCTTGYISDEPSLRKKYIPGIAYWKLHVGKPNEMVVSIPTTAYPYFKRWFSVDAMQEMLDITTIYVDNEHNVVYVNGVPEPVPWGDPLRHLVDGMRDPTEPTPDVVTLFEDRQRRVDEAIARVLRQQIEPK